MGKLQRLMIKGGFDYIVMTHFMPTEIAAALKRSGRISSKLVTVITDFDVHRIWLAEGIDTYTVASAWTKEKLKKIGIPQEKIFVSGIPTDRKFSGPFDLDALRKTFRLKENMFTVLVATGSFGIGPIQEIIETLAGFQILVVCGHNQDLYRTLSAGGRTDVHVFGLVDNMQELMAVSDAMVTKPGGLSISEALVSRLPMIFFSAIPGQETGNIRVLKTYGIGISGCSIAQIGEELNRMNNSREIFHAAREKIGVLARPSAVSDIISLLR
jgi:processive 1,2-diacylglycerol beta-glucosyltransferase